MDIKEKSLSYKDAGVDTKEGERAVSLMKNHVSKTFNENVLTGLGSFGSLFKLDMTSLKEPVLVSGTDGVGTKLKIAFMMDKHDTVGIDCVAMCVNDILCQGAKPLFFLDYIATGKVKAEKIEEIVKGIAEGCIQGQSALIGGETAEMPNFYQDGEYDMAGFSVGVVDKEKIITGEKIEENHIIIGLSSSGIHSNGYSLVRKIFFEKMDMKLDTYVDDLKESLGDALIKPTKIYAKACERIIGKFDIKGMVHITGGGFYENIPRVLPKGLGVEIRKDSFEILPIFKYIQKCGNVKEEDMFATYNMGIGMMIIISETERDVVIKALEEAGETPKVIGKVIKGEGVKIC